MFTHYNSLFFVTFVPFCGNELPFLGLFLCVLCDSVVEVQFLGAKNSGLKGGATMCTTVTGIAEGASL